MAKHHGLRIQKPKPQSSVFTPTIDFLWDKGFLMGVEFGVKQSEAGHNLQRAQEEARKALDSINQKCSEEP